ncbi:MAG: transglutaminase-like domain-containing protein, partial [Bacillota bacterium]
MRITLSSRTIAITLALALVLLSLPPSMVFAASSKSSDPVKAINPIALELTYKISRSGSGTSVVDIPVLPVSSTGYYTWISEQVPDDLTEQIDALGNRSLQASMQSGQELTLRFTVALNQASYQLSKTATQTVQPSELSRYLMPSTMIESQAQPIVSRARQATSGEKTEAGKVAKIASFVQNHLDPYQGSEERSALWALNNGWGGIREKARLFTALCRAAGVPARVVTGLRYASSSLSSYAVNVTYPLITTTSLWAEAYLPGAGWTPMDFAADQPVFGQLSAYLLPLSIESDKVEPTTSTGWVRRQSTLKRLNTVGNRPPEAVITVSPDGVLTTASELNFSAYYSTDPDGDKIVREEWENKQSQYAVGKHRVRLRVMDERGAWSRWVEKTLTVSSPNAKPTVEITLNTKGTLTPQTTIVLGYKAKDPDKDAIVQEEWLNKQTTYPAGSHLVWLRVMDARGAWSDWAQKQIEVIAPNRPPQAVITVEPEGEPNTTTEVRWSSRQSSDPDGDPIIEEQWQNQKTTYPAGTHKVKLRVKDIRGLWSDWAEQQITVAQGNRSPVAKISASPNQGLVAPASVSLTSSGSSDPDGDAIVKEEWQNKL